MRYPDTTQYLIGAELEFFTMVMMMFRRVLKIGFVIVKVIYDVDFEHAPHFDCCVLLLLCSSSLQ